MECILLRAAVIMKDKNVGMEDINCRTYNCGWYDQHQHQCSLVSVCEALTEMEKNQNAI